MNDYTVAIYLRLSIDDVRSESISIESQRLLLTEYAEKMPVQNVKIVEYTDNGYTGTNFERPAVQRLLSDIQLNKINCILVKDFSRFGRNSIEVGYFTQQVFPLFNVRFISVSDCFDSDEHKGDTGGMNIAFKYLINEYYSRDISIKVKTARQIRIRNGEYCTGQYPYGYKFDENKKLIIDDEVADNVRTIFKLYTEGVPKTQIAKHLSDKGIPTPIQYKAQKGLSSCDISKCKYWKSETIANILSNEIYMGMYVMGKRQVTDVGSKRRILKTEDKWVKIPNHHPAIISEEIFRKASETKPVYKRKGENTRIYPLRSKVFCGCCNHSMEYIKAKNSRFKCKYTRLYGNEPCYQLSITEEALHKQIFDMIVYHKKALEQQEDNGIRNCMEQLTAIDEKIALCQQQKQCLYEKLVSEEISAEEFKTLKDQCNAEIQQYEQQKCIGLKSAETLKAHNASKARLKDILKDLSKETTLTQELSDALVEKVYVYPDKSIKVEWKIQDFEG